jgi:MEKHLA domain
MTAHQVPFNSHDFQRFIARHTSLLCSSYSHWTGQVLSNDCMAEGIWHAPFAIVSHGVEAEPIFNYGNALALSIFDYSWQAFTQLPSKQSAEPMNQAARRALLDKVAKYGYVDDYEGVRINSKGQRFLIQQATVWNLLDEDGHHYGQAAKIAQWRAL